MFAWSKDELSDEQEGAILHPGSVFLVACPGSGKTRAVTYKIALELSKPDLGKRFVIAITYTHRAADEIRERIEDLGVETSQLWIGTIHSFCLEWILTPYGIYHESLERGFRVLDQHEQEKLLEDLCSPYTRPRITYWDCGYHYTRTGYVLACRDEAKQAGLEAIFRGYFRHLEENRVLDFELILYRSYQLLASRPAIAKVLSKVFSFILLDEFQDTKDIQYSIITDILKAGAGDPRVFIVGDPNQAIYDSLGGFAIEFERFREMAGFEIAEMALTRNFRSSQRIIGYFGNFALTGAATEAAGRERDYPSRITYESAMSHQDLVGEVQRLIVFNVEQIGIKPHEICVLAPQWFHLASMTRRLAAAMPGYSFDGPGMVPFARDFENFWFKLARIALTEPAPGVFIRRLRWANEILADLVRAGVEVNGLDGRGLLRSSNSIHLDEVDGLEYLRAYFDEICVLIGVDFSAHTALLSHHSAFFEASARRIQRLRSEGPEYLGDVASFRRVFQPRAGITISTIHGIKGAEFDTVIAFGILQGMVPHFNDPNQHESAMKLLYVAASRARKNLHLISERGRVRYRDEIYQPTAVLANCVFGYDHPA